MTPTEVRKQIEGIVAQFSEALLKVENEHNVQTVIYREPINGPVKVAQVKILGEQGF